MAAMRRRHAPRRESMISNVDKTVQTPRAPPHVCHKRPMFQVTPA
jgi:hypothetical protein